MKRLFILSMLLCGLSITALAQTGKITGKLTYPSEFMPADTVVCVKYLSLYAEPVYCSNNSASVRKKGNITFRLNLNTATYQVSLPAGNYLIYAMTKEMPGLKAYYDEYVKCGMTVKCKSITPVQVRVRAGQTTKGITVGDFFFW